MDYKWRMGKYLAYIKKNSDDESHILDATIIKVHQHACGAIGKSPYQQAIGKTAGGWTTKIHIVCDALGLPIDFWITVGQRHESTLAKYLLTKRYSDQVIMDTAYDSNPLRNFMEERGRKCVIPCRCTRKCQEEYDTELYKERHLVECLICRMKAYRRIATRYDKLGIAYHTMIILSFILIWLRF